MKCIDCHLPTSHSKDRLCPKCKEEQVKLFRAYKNSVPRCVEINEVEPGLFIGNQDAATDWPTLSERGIRHVVRAGYGLEAPFPADIKYLMLDIDDSTLEDIGSYFEECFEFIQEGRKSGAVLVHCAAGVSRSATIVISYLMRQRGIGWEEAYAFLKSRRKEVFPNHGFRNQLQKYEDKLKAS